MCRVRILHYSRDIIAGFQAAVSTRCRIHFDRLLYPFFLALSFQPSRPFSVSLTTTSLSATSSFFGWPSFLRVMVLRPYRGLSPDCISKRIYEKGFTLNVYTFNMYDMERIQRTIKKTPYSLKL